MTKSLQNKQNSNRRLSKKKNIKGGVPKTLPPNYMYLIYTPAVCAEGNYLLHIRYLGLNVKQAFQYYHSLFTEYIELLKQKGILSAVHRITLNQCRGYSEIGRHYLNLSGRDEWLQNPLDAHSTVQIINAFNFREILRRNAVDHLVQSELNTDAYDSYLPILAKLNISTGTITRDIFFHTDDISDDSLVVEENLYNYVDNGNVPETTYELIEQLQIVPEKVVILHFLQDLAMFTSDKVSEENDVDYVRSVINTRYPNAHELNSIDILPTVIDNPNVMLTNDAYTFKIPVEGFDISAYNIVTSEDFIEITPAEETSLKMNSLAPITKVMGRT